MIVWLASFPRSGNTFFRIVLHALYGINTYSGFLSGDDIENDLGRTDITGHGKLPHSELYSGSEKTKHWLNKLESDSEVYFIKTHALPSQVCNSKARAILLVRDGRDAGISFAHYLIDTLYTWPRFVKNAKNYIEQKDYLSFRKTYGLFLNASYTILVLFLKLLHCKNKLFTYCLKRFLVSKNGSRWTLLNREWINRTDALTSIVRFEDLVKDPITCIQQTLKNIGVDFPQNGRSIPSFEELHALHPKFFRSGQSGTWQTVINEELNNKFWETDGQMMNQLGYLKNNSFEK